jgi:hypothetical protein
LGLDPPSCRGGPKTSRAPPSTAMRLEILTGREKSVHTRIWFLAQYSCNETAPLAVGSASHSYVTEHYGPLQYGVNVTLVVALMLKVLTTVVKNSVFWAITSYSPLKVNRRFGETSLHFQCRKVSQTRNQLEADSKQFAT